MSLEKSFNAAEAEARIYPQWETSGAFRAGAGKRRDDTFCIMIPPPNVTGSLHMGHAFNNTLQDILTRWHRMRGFDTLWQPGQDHAGIATQMVVERQLAAEGNESRRDMGREKFLNKVWSWKQESGGTIINQLKRLGASCDWSRNAFTMSGAPNAPAGEEGNFHDAVIKVFVDLYNKGLIYRGKRLVNWDPHFETAISDLEVEQIEQDGHMWRLRYPLEGGETYEHPTEFDEDGNVTATETRDYLTVATTRPETMLGDTGVAVHPDDRRYAHLVGKTVRLPLVGRSIPIVADDYADPEKGTGAVKMTPAHDFNDWEVGKRANLPAINVMTPRAGMYLKGNAEWLDGADPEGTARLIEALDGMDRYEARDWIVTTAEEEGWLDGIDADRHMVPHGDRSKVAIEPYLTDQWFVDSAKIVQPALDAVRDGRTEILPDQHRKVYFNWLENIEPWCISRQLWWGHQVPVWYGPGLTDDGHVDYSASAEKLFCAASFEEAAALARAHYGVEEVHERADLGDTIEDQLESFSHESSAVSLYRDPDVLDTWFSSGLWPIGTLGWPEDTDELKRYFPTSTLITGFDIIFFWVARMMMMQLAVVNEVPFRRVYVHALVRDEKGKKMSKSLGNVLDPLELIDEFGADAVRFTMTSMAAMGRDLKLSASRIQGYRNFTTKLWNAARFAEMNGAYTDAIPTQYRRAAEARNATNRWIAGEVARTRQTVDEALQNHRFNDAANALYSFVWGTVCDWYLELSKPLFASEDPDIVEETRATMAWVIDQCLILLHPFMPFVTEELWGSLTARDNMLVVEPWPEYEPTDFVDEKADAEMSWVIALIEEIRSIRGEMGVPAGAKIPLLVQELDTDGRAALDANAALIERLARLEGISEAPAPKGAVTVTVRGASMALPLADVIDIASEKSRLEKSSQKLAKEIGGLSGRLRNPKFVESAPEDVVQETRQNLALREAEAARIGIALERLQEMG